MITIQQVYKDENIRGFATIDSNNSETFWITYVDYNLIKKTNKIIMFKNIPYSRKGPCDFYFGTIIEQYD